MYSGVSRLESQLEYRYTDKRFPLFSSTPPNKYGDNTTSDSFSVSSFPIDYAIITFPSTIYVLRLIKLRCIKRKQTSYVFILYSLLLVFLAVISHFVTSDQRKKHSLSDVYIQTIVQISSKLIVCRNVGTYLPNHQVSHLHDHRRGTCSPLSSTTRPPRPKGFTPMVDTVRGSSA